MEKLWRWVIVSFLALLVTACGGEQAADPPATIVPPTANIYSISGTATAGTALNLTGARSASTTSDANGSYKFDSLANGTYTITPSLATRSFSPLSRTVVVNGANVTGVNFADQAVVNVPALNQGTLLGIYNAPTPEALGALGVRGTRIIVSARDMETYVAQLGRGDEPELLKALKPFRAANHAVVVSLNWSSGVPAPSSINDTLARLDAFTRSVGPYVSAIVLDNEPEATAHYPAQDTTPDANGRYPLIEFYRQIAVVVDDALTTTNNSAKVSGPAFTRLPDRVQNKLTPERRRFQDALIALVNEDNHLDFGDIHLHLDTIENLRAVTDLARSLIVKPLITTEWSQARAATLWLMQPLNADFAARWGRNPAQTNETFMIYCFSAPISKAEWDQFVATVPAQPDYISAGFDYLAASGFRFVAYGQYGQSSRGESIFQWKQLYATETVVPLADGARQENSRFPSEIRLIAPRSTG